jgi:hypothetical protein
MDPAAAAAQLAGAPEGSLTVRAGIASPRRRLISAC